MKKLAPLFIIFLFITCSDPFEEIEEPDEPVKPDCNYCDDYEGFWRSIKIEIFPNYFSVDTVYDEYTVYEPTHPNKYLKVCDVKHAQEFNIEYVKEGDFHTFTLSICRDNEIETKVYWIKRMGTDKGQYYSLGKYFELYPYFPSQPLREFGKGTRYYFRSVDKWQGLMTLGGGGILIHLKRQ